MGMLISIRGILNIGKTYFFSQKVVYLYLALLANVTFLGPVSETVTQTQRLDWVTSQRLGLKRSRLEPPGIVFFTLKSWIHKSLSRELILDYSLGTNSPTGNTCRGVALFIAGICITPQVELQITDISNRASTLK